MNKKSEYFIVPLEKLKKLTSSAAVDVLFIYDVEIRRTAGFTL